MVGAALSSKDNKYTGDRIKSMAVKTKTIFFVIVVVCVFLFTCLYLQGAGWSVHEVRRFTLHTKCKACW